MIEVWHIYNNDPNNPYGWSDYFIQYEYEGETVRYGFKFPMVRELL